MTTYLHLLLQKLKFSGHFRSAYITHNLYKIHFIHDTANPSCRKKRYSNSFGQRLCNAQKLHLIGDSYSFEHREGHLRAVIATFHRETFIGYAKHTA